MQVPPAWSEIQQANQDPFIIDLYPSRFLPYDNTWKEVQYRWAESQFFRVMEGYRFFCRVVCVSCIINPFLRSRYDAFKSDQVNAAEMVMFHGTDESNIEKIAKDGFKIGGEQVDVRHGAWQGSGIYLSESGAALEYCSSRKRGRLIMCTVCPSNDTIVNWSWDHRYIFEMVVKHKDQVMPTHIVHFEEVQISETVTKSPIMNWLDAFEVMKRQDKAKKKTPIATRYSRRIREKSVMQLLRRK